MSAAQLLCQQVCCYLAENPKTPARAKAEQAKGRLAQPVVQGAFAQLFGQFVGKQAALHGGGKAHHGDHFAVAVARPVHLVAPLRVAAVDQLAHGPVVGLSRFLSIQKPEVSCFEAL